MTVPLTGAKFPVLKQYQKNPVKFVREVIRAEPRTFQKEALENLVLRNREQDFDENNDSSSGGYVCMRSPHGCGKSTLIAWAILWGLACFPNIVIPTTALAWRQLKSMLWPQVHFWLEQSLLAQHGFHIREGHELLGTSLTLGPLRRSYALAAKDEARIEGVHAPIVMYVFDEAREIPVSIWDAASGAAIGNEFMSLAVSTPGAPAGRFYEIQSSKPGFEHWHTIAVTEKQAEKEVKNYRNIADMYEKMWGRSSPVFRRRVLGEFAEDEEDALFPLYLIEEAQARWWELAKRGNDERILLKVGMDVGGSGASQSVIAKLYDDNYVAPLDVYKNPDTNKNVMFLQNAMKESYMNGAFMAEANVDALGIGVGVADVASDAGLPVNAINVSIKTKNKDKTGVIGFNVLRSELAWRLRERLDPAITDEDELIALPPDDELVGDLVSMRYRSTSNGIKVESKREIKRRLGRSPDKGDAVILLMAEPYSIPQIQQHPGANPFFN